MSRPAAGRERKALVSRADDLVEPQALIPPYKHSMHLVLLVLRRRWMSTPAYSTSARSRFGDAAFLAFVVVQIADGFLTYRGITIFGVGIEANPLVAWCVSTFGVALSLIAIKLFAVTCGSVLHLNTMHGAVGVLTLVVLAAAVWPWTGVLTSAF
jgi:hypothetical protein